MHLLWKMDFFSGLEGERFAARTDVSTWDAPDSQTAGRGAETGA